MPPFLLLVAQVPVPPAPPPPPVPAPAVPAELRNPHDIARAKDYPRAALRAEAQGAVRFRVAVSAKGRPTGCVVTESSGNADLDAATCRQVLKRARFVPARNAAGRKVPDSYTRRVVWVLGKP